MKILIAGCGDVGCRLGKLLVAQGHQVWGLRRNPAALPRELAPIAADLSDPSSLERLPVVDVVCYAAAASGGGEGAYRAAYVDGLQNLLRGLEAQRSSIRRLLFTSSTGVYHQKNGERVDEGSQARPGRYSGQIMLEAEDLVRNGDFPGTVVRFSGIYGPGRFRLIERVAAGYACAAEPPLYTNRIHADDCAAVLAHLIGLARPDDLYLGSDCLSTPMHEVVVWMRRILEEMGVAVAPASIIPAGRSSKQCVNHKLLATGFQFQYPNFRGGYRSAIMDWVAQINS